ncbi:serine protease [Niastella yeongjuensis]|uniref:Serine protease n=1 Tax=Niastella yeongjuensis TaxID=354355 RepID=A0A1V9EWC8_9BACT|nr:nodulation protein NfeD [Niastella yeongjuensis]OQP50443.1 serine protease [Niastella yeongjuensis]SEN34259.1 membrane-bound serine protease (ClpP class) [Niastella yeongjuensis]
MRRILLYCFLLVFISGPLYAQKVLSIKLDATINPATADFIHRAIEVAQKERATCLLIHLNTPGGLLQSTRIIVSDILESSVPVVVYVSPGGAHAGSAGVFITMAAHIAAMAPGTNIGAAHPVVAQGQMDTIMSAKATNDAMAFIRSIAKKRERNANWGAQAVSNSVSLTETEALENNVINLIASNEQELLNKIDGKSVTVSSGTVILQTKHATIQSLEMGWGEKMLNILSDPNVAYILFLLGLYGLIFELYSPGAIFPGIIGGICMILALYTMHTLPVNYAGLALIVFGIILFLLEIKIVSHGLLAIGGVISLLLGSMMLIRTGETTAVAGLSWTVIITAVGITTLFFLFVVGLGLKAQRAKPAMGLEAMVGEIGQSLSELNPGGTVRMHGEIWKAISSAGLIPEGKKVIVTGILNLTLQVEAYHESSV